MAGPLLYSLIPCVRLAGAGCSEGTVGCLINRLENVRRAGVFYCQKIFLKNFFEILFRAKNPRSAIAKVRALW